MNRGDELIPRGILRAMYRRGIELAPGTSAVFLHCMPGGEKVRLVVRNGGEGLVDVSCGDKRVVAELRSIIGFRVELSSRTGPATKGGSVPGVAAKRATITP